MAGYLVRKCPHCLVPKISLVIVNQQADPDSNLDCFLNLFCQNCLRPVGVRARLMRDGSSPLTVLASQFGGTTHRVVPPPSGDAEKAGWDVIEIWPDYPRPNLPDHLPAEVAKPFLAAERNFPEDGMEEAAAGSYGRALDVGTKLFVPQHAAQKLNNRIDKMRKEGLITQSLWEWAHLIKSIRNDALHDIESIDREELKAIRGFTETLLTYLFTLPGMLAERKAAAQAGLSQPAQGEGTEVAV